MIRKSDLYDLDFTLAEIILPYLVAFKKLKRTSCPSQCKSLKEWNRILDEMIFAVKKVASGRAWKFDKRVQIGLELFGIHFTSLWD